MTGIEPELLLLLGAATIAGGALAFFTGLLLFGAQRRTQQRLTALSARWQRNGAGEGDPAAPRLRRRQADSSLPLLDAIIKRVMPRPQMLRERLARTGRSISIAKYLTWSLIFGLVMTGAGIFAFDFPLVPSLLGGIVATFGVPHMAIGFLVRRRQSQFTALFPEAIDLIVRGLRSGLPVSESMRTVGEEMADPMGAEFRQIGDEIEFGKTLEEAMVDAIPRIGTPEFKFFVVALSVQRETGGNLGETLANLSDVLRKRRQMKQKIKAMASEPKASAWILG